MKGFYFLFLIAILPFYSIFSQHCGSEDLLERSLREHPHLKEILLQQEKQRVLHQSQQLKHGKLAATLYTIPVVVHIIHDNGSENLSNAQVQTAIDNLNKMFRHQAPWNGPGGADVEIQFCLAKQDPLGNATNGINRIVDPVRTNHTYFSSAADLALKNLSRWDPTKYINIWTVKVISGPVAGYAYFPSAHGMAIDGIVSEAGYLNGPVLTHEMGHYFNLHHTFNSGCANNDCDLDGDHVCDTPPVGSSSGCSRNSCSTDENDLSTNNPFRPIANGGIGDQNDMANNYMDYSPLGCMNAFSPGQKDRMRYALTQYRASLTSAFGCVDPCPAVISFTINPNTPAVAGIPHTILNTSSNATTWQWFVNNSLVSGTQNLLYTFPNGGNYTIRLQASNSNISCTKDTSFSLMVSCPAMSAQFSSSANPSVAGNVISFTNTTVTSLDTSGQNRWYINGMLVSSQKDFQHLFNTPGTFEVKLVVGENASSCTSIHTELIRITCGANAQFTSSATSAAINSTLSFTNTSSGAISYQWLLNGTPASTLTDYSQLFASEGDYMISLVAYNGICYDTLHQIISIFNPSVCRSNRQNDNWYFGNTASVNFATGTPVAMLSSAMNTPEGVATISSPSGNLLFYTNGVTVWDRTHVIMMNGTGLAGNVNATQAALIVQQPGVDSLYYIFTTSSASAPGELRYSVVNMNLNGGLGAVVPSQKNIFLRNSITEKLAATYQGNGCDLWIMTHGYQNNQFIAYPLSSTGIGTPVITSIGRTHQQSKGQIKFSPDGSKLSAAHYSTGMEVFDFNHFSGVVSNALDLNDKYLQPYGTEFSPDNSKVYFNGIAESQGTLSGNMCYLIQYDLSLSGAAAIKASETPIGLFSSQQPVFEGSFGSMQLGKDGKIYTTFYSRFASSTFLHTINAPNIAGVGCSYQQNALSLSGRQSTLGLPAILSSSTHTANFKPECTSNSMQVNFIITSGGTGADSYFWDFGDPASGISNTSGNASPDHVFSGPGTYTVTLVIKKTCQCATVSKSITIPFLCTLPSGDLQFQVFAKGSEDLLIWNLPKETKLESITVERRFDNTASQEIAKWSAGYSPGRYEAAVSAVDQNKERYYRLALEEKNGNWLYSEWQKADAMSRQFLIFPNPGQGVYQIHTSSPSEATLQVYSSTGVWLSEKTFEENTELNLTELPDGLYEVILRTGNEMEVHRIVIRR
ncbi:MAG: PKD domain-containing protein [Cytophagaceae bacterium]|jgi:PKD repeat protein|nr:PKD domain-containing protein [Cytophagaceae bacterium]